ncbi:MAG TPA: VOC family protein [Thermoplasmata archaeon]|nr:VOC family protein [Thermoplasmata archaeon]
MATKKKVKARGKTAVRKEGAARLEMNHVMVYSADVPRSLTFYRDMLGLKVIEEMEGYARLRAGGNSTLGLHTIHAQIEGMMDPSLEGVRIYLEVRDLDRLCAKLAAKGVKFDSMPKDMPWGWRHAYFRDPDGHELSLYWAGKKRFEKKSF